jgi:hypothetical protein
MYIAYLTVAIVTAMFIAYLTVAIVTAMFIAYLTVDIAVTITTVSKLYTLL